LIQGFGLSRLLWVLSFILTEPDQTDANVALLKMDIEALGSKKAEPLGA
jgi:hypothetical protein